MDDITYTFNQTNRERKELVPSARKRVNGSKSKSCTLPSDSLTPAQLRKLNGPVRDYNLHEPMSWEQFKTMPKDLQESYLNYVSQRFRVGVGTISVHLFGLDRVRLPHYCRMQGLTYPTRGGKTSEATRAALTAWAKGESDQVHVAPEAAPEGLLSEDSEPVETVEPDIPDIPDTPDRPVEPDEPVSSDEPVSPTTRNPITSATLRMAGEAEEILEFLTRFMGAGKVMVDVNITFIKEEN